MRLPRISPTWRARLFSAAMLLSLIAAMLAGGAHAKWH